MKINDEISLSNFEAWSGAKDTKERIMDEGLDQDFDNLIDELYPEGLSATKLNDILWFDEDWVYESLGIKIKE